MAHMTRRQRNTVNRSEIDIPAITEQHQKSTRDDNELVRRRTRPIAATSPASTFNLEQLHHSHLVPEQLIYPFRELKHLCKIKNL